MDQCVWESMCSTVVWGRLEPTESVAKSMYLVRLLLGFLLSSARGSRCISVDEGSRCISVDGSQDFFFNKGNFCKVSKCMHATAGDWEIPMVRCLRSRRTRGVVIARSLDFRLASMMRAWKVSSRRDREKSGSKTFWILTAHGRTFRPWLMIEYEELVRYGSSRQSASKYPRDGGSRVGGC
jgi:hypothetical protein